MKRAAGWIAAASMVIILGAVAMGIVGIWTGDDRWSSTGLVVGITAFFMGAGALFTVGVITDYED